jgi:hypothetical protein
MFGYRAHQIEDFAYIGIIYKSIAKHAPGLADYIKQYYVKINEPGFEDIWKVKWRK